VIDWSGVIDAVMPYEPFFVSKRQLVVDVGGVADVERQAFVTLVPAASRTVPVIVVDCFVPVVGSGVGDGVRVAVRVGVAVGVRVAVGGADDGS
jgi:sorbitol-specific phosphotransferase system component IIBC